MNKLKIARALADRMMDYAYLISAVGIVLGVLFLAGVRGATLYILFGAEMGIVAMWLWVVVAFRQATNGQ